MTEELRRMSNLLMMFDLVVFILCEKTPGIKGKEE